MENLWYYGHNYGTMKNTENYRTSINEEEKNMVDDQKLRNFDL